MIRGIKRCSTRSSLFRFGRHLPFVQPLRIVVAGREEIDSTTVDARKPDDGEDGNGEDGDPVALLHPVQIGGLRIHNIPHVEPRREEAAAVQDKGRVEEDDVALVPGVRLDDRHLFGGKDGHEEEVGDLLRGCERA